MCGLVKIQLHVFFAWIKPIQGYCRVIGKEERITVRDLIKIQFVICREDVVLS